MSWPSSSGEDGVIGHSIASTREGAGVNIEMRPAPTVGNTLAEQSPTEHGLPDGSTVHNNMSISTSGSHRVQFSSKAEEQASGPPAPAPIITQGILKKASTWSNDSNSQRSAPSPSSISPSVSLPRTRSRGYSLRKSIFTQNIQKQSNEDGTVIEM